MANRTYNDPPGMPADERMTPAELKVAREFLGVSGDWLAGHLGVTPRAVRQWEEGRYAIPDEARQKIEALELRTGEHIGAAVAQLNDMPDPAVITYRSDAEYHAAHPEVPFPASWHRRVCARIALEVPGLSITYAEPPSAAGEEPAQARSA